MVITFASQAQHKHEIAPDPPEQNLSEQMQLAVGETSHDILDKGWGDNSLQPGDDNG